MGIVEIKKIDHSTRRSTMMEIRLAACRGVSKSNLGGGGRESRLGPQCSERWTKEVGCGQGLFFMKHTSV